MTPKQPGFWGIDLGQCALKAIRVESREGEVVATAFDYIEHPKILSQPDADPDQLIREALEQFLSRNDLKGDQVAISVPGQSGLARFVKLPPVEEKKIDAIVTFEAKQQIPFPLEEVVWDFQKLGQGAVSDGYALETEIGLFAMKRDVVHRALQQYKDVNVEVHVVQMSPLALCNFVAFDQLRRDAEADGEEEEQTAGEQECVVALDIGTDNSNLVVTDGNRIIWQRPIPLGGNHFTRTLTKELKLTFAKAEHIKRNAIKSPELKKILTALRPVLNDFVNELQRSLGYFTNTHRNATITQMIGLGNVFRLPGLQKFLQEKLQLPVHRLTKFNRLGGEDVTEAPQFSENIMSFAVAYGLAVQGLDMTRLRTNLLPQQIRTERMIRAKKPWAAATAAALLLAVAGLTFGRAVQYSTYTSNEVKAALDASEQAIDLANQQKNAFDQHEAEAKKNELAVNRIASGVDERFNWILVNKYINDVLPEPNSQKLTLLTEGNFRTWQQYWTTDARDAYQKWLQWRNPPDKKPDQEDKMKPQEKKEQEKDVLEDLIQVNIEGVNCLFAEDLSHFFKNIDTSTEGLLLSMRDEDKKAVKEKAETLPTQGWVFEVRGYTYHKDQERFVRNTFLENLRRPEKMWLGETRDGKNVFYTLSEAMKERVADKISFAFMYKHNVDKKPFPGKFTLINKGELRKLINPMMMGPEGAPGGFVAPGMDEQTDTMTGEVPEEPSMALTPTRTSWKPIGEVASAVIGAGVTGGEFGESITEMEEPIVEEPGEEGEYGEIGASLPGLQPRTEFIILFIWQEPSTLESGADVADGEFGAAPTEAAAAAPY